MNDSVDLVAGKGPVQIATMAQIEQSHYALALQTFGYNVTEAAKALGVGRATMYRKIKEYKLKRRE